MRAAVFYGCGDVRVEQVEISEPKDNELQVRVKAAGICGTDIHIFKGAKGATECHPPVILGHEFMGVVEKTGNNVHRVKIGDHVVLDPNISCGECYYCRLGKVHFCEHLTAIGVDCNGGFAELCNVPEKQAYILPQDIPSEIGAMCEPIACCLHGIDLAQIKCGDTVAIVGGGTIGLIMLQLAKIAGATKTVLLEPIAEKRALAMRLGADITIDPIKDDVGEVLMANNIFDINVAVECVGQEETVLQTIELAGKGACVLLFGLTPPDCKIPFMPFKAFQKELTLKASFINPSTQGRAVELIKSGRLKIDELISETIPLEGIEMALTMKQHNGKVIIRP